MARRSNDPFTNYNFNIILEISGLQSAGFSECSGLQMETKLFSYKEGGRNETTLQFPEHASYGNVTLKRGITIINSLLLGWLKDIAFGRFSLNPRTVGGLRNNTKKVSIVLLNEKREEVGRWILIGALPVKWTGPDLKATGNEIAIESLEIAYEGIETEKFKS